MNKIESFTLTSSAVRAARRVTMKVRYKELEHCIEIYDDDRSIMMNVEDAEILVHRLNAAILEARERKKVKTFVKPYEPF